MCKEEGNMKYGLDFDGVLRRYPFPFNIVMKYTSPTDILERSHLLILKKVIYFFDRNFIPFILNGNLINNINTIQDTEFIIISARRESTEKILSCLKKYIHIKKAYFREDRPIYEECWKLKICKEENVDVFLEDRKFVVDFLRKNGVKVIEI